MAKEEGTQAPASESVSGSAPQESGQAEASASSNAKAETAKAEQGDAGYAKAKPKGEFLTHEQVMELAKQQGIVKDGDKKEKKLPEDADIEVSEKEVREIQKEHDGSTAEEVEGGDAQDQEDQKEKDSTYFELKHNGEVQKVTRDKAIELAQKGLDYTKKTMELSEERKSFESQKQELEEVLNQKAQELEQAYGDYEKNVKQYQEWDYLLSSMKESDPDLYQDIVDFKDRQSSQLNNPLLQQMQEQMAQQAEMIRKLTEVHSDQQVSSNFKRELSEVQEEYGPALQKLGMEVDWDGKVKEAWINGEPLNLSVRDAFLKEYGSQLFSRYNSMSKVDNVKKQVEARKTVPTAGTARAANRESGPDFSKYRKVRNSNSKKLDYGAITQDILRGNIRIPN